MTTATTHTTHSKMELKPSNKPALGMIRFSVPGKIYAKGRPRVTVQGGYAHAYTPKTTADYETEIRACANQAAGSYRFEAVPLAVGIEAIFQRPKRGQTATYVTKRPDADNIAKAVLDAIQGEAGIIPDDALVSDLRVTKLWAPPGEEEVLLVKVETLKEEGGDD